MFGSIFLKKRSVIFNWLFPYIIFLIIFVVVSFLIYYNTTDIIENEVNNANTVLLKSAQNDMDKVLEEARKISVESLFNVGIQRLLNLKNDVSDSEYYDVIKVLQDLKVYNTSSNSVGDIYIMLKGINKVVGLGGIMDIDTFYQYTYGLDISSYDNWLKEYDEKIVQKYSLVFINPERLQNKILYIRSLSAIDNKNLSTSITVTINEGNLKNQLSIIAKINKGTAFILDKNNKVVTSTNPISLPMDLILSLEKNDRNPIYTTLDGKKVVVSYTFSDINDWKYITIVPENVFLEKVNRIRTITYSGIFFCFFLGAILIYYFLKKNYNPINKLLSILLSQPNFINEGKDVNEYAIIESGLKKAIDDKDIITNQLKSQKLMLRTNFIEKLLKGSVLEDIPINEVLHSYNIIFDSNYFSVALIHLDDVLGDNTTIISNFNDILFIFSNIIEEMIGENHKGFIIEVDGTLVCLININNNRLSEVKSDLLKAVEESQKFINEHFHIQFTVSIGSMHEGIDQIQLSYRESLDAMDYKKVLGIEHTFCFEDIYGNYQGTYYYPLNKEQQLINFIKCGDYTNAKLTLEEIFEINFVKNHLPLDLAQCLMLNMVSTMIRAVNEVLSHSRDKFLEDLNPISRLLPCKSVEEMKHQLNIFLKTFCNHMNQINKSSANWIVNDVVPFIQKHYSDINLSVSDLAETFDIHPVYISKVFKDEIGDGLLDYINKTRIDNAKLLLKAKKDYNLEDISKEVGFGNVRTFSRVFKKYEGVTPGKFKDIL